MTSLGRLAAGLSTFVVFTSAVHAQERRTILSAQVCGGCRVQLIPVVQLIAPDTLPAVVSITRLTQGGPGEYLLSPLADDASYIALSSRGSLRRFVTRHGAGPGEWNGLRLVRRYHGDTLLVLTNRVSLVVHDSTLVAKAPVAQPWDVAVLEGGEVVMNSPGGGGHTLQLWAPGLRSAIVIDDSSAHVKHPFAPSILRVAASRDGGFWSAPTNTYQFTRRRADGSTSGRYVRQADWFPDWGANEQAESFIPGGHLLPRIMSLREDSLGMLWILVNVPTGRRAPSGDLRAGRGKEPVAMPGVASWGIEFRSVIEVIDPAAGSLLTTFRSPEILSGFVGEDQVYGLREVADGSIAVNVFRVSLIEPSRGR